MISAVFNVFLAIPAVVLALALVAFLQGASDSGGGSGGTQQGLDPKISS